MKHVLSSSPPRGAELRHFAARMAIVGSIAAVGVLGSLHLLSPEFDPSFRMISEYALGRHGAVLSWMFAIWGVSTWALAFAIWPDVPTTRGRLGTWCLLAAGSGEVLAAVFDVTHELGHGVAGLLGIVGLPIAAVLVTVSLEGRWVWQHAGAQLRRRSAHATWIAVLLLLVTMALMTAQFAHVNGGRLPQHAPRSLPPGVWGLSGWANRLIVLANCWWVAVVAWQAIAIGRIERRRNVAGEQTAA
jgi:Protein of unknown function (DUF998)